MIKIDNCFLNEEGEHGYPAGWGTTFQTSAVTKNSLFSNVPKDDLEESKRG